MLSILTPRSSSTSPSSSKSHLTTNPRKPSSSKTSVTDATTTQAKIAFLNQSLEALHDVFPSGDVDEFRRLLSTTSEESRLYVVTEMLLKSYKDSGRGVRTGGLEPWEMFRSDEYRTAVKKALCKEFRGLSKSTVQAVMAEHNFAYIPSRATLAGIAAKSWRFSFSNFFRRAPRAPPPTASTGCKELDDELFSLGADKRQEQVSTDRTLAEKLNEEEYAAGNELLECECCFEDYAWEQTAACTEGHFFCHMCLVRAVQEGVYGQGHSLLAEKSSIRCLSSSAQPPCLAFVALDVLRAVLPSEVYQQLDDRTSSESLEKSGLRLVRCPFCGYAEVDELQPLKPRSRALALLTGLFTIALLFLPLLLLTILTILTPTLLLCVRQDYLTASAAYQFLEQKTRRIQLRRRGTRFRCGAPRCSRASCITCSKPWAPFHKCYEAEADAARIYVERAMADAVKRTCPLCNLSFIKSDGCNKLTCPCGYVMCYICRSDIRGVGYTHFCQHFRQVPGTPCNECEACDLYAAEDEAKVVQKAKRGAEKDYYRLYGRPGVDKKGGAPEAMLEIGADSDGMWEEIGRRLEAVIEMALDWVLE